MRKQPQPLKWVIVAALALAIAIGAYAVLTAHDRRTAGERVNDALGDLSRGVNNAEQRLQNHTPARRIGDAFKGATGE